MTAATLKWTAPLAVTGGYVRGVVAPDGVRSFKGIPYAAPPVNELRWRAPQPVRPWQGERLADRYASACVQPLMRRDSFMRQFSFADPPECGMSEDCLYLNVWTTAENHDAALPVIVWVHGGGYRVCAGSHPISEGVTLARQGAVVVTINYRLGALGHLAHPELTRESGCSGNYSCLDVIQALEWVRDNIVRFGGDPQCVTLFGQSAGAAMVSVLMAAPRARGLFHRVIAHSAGRFPGGPMGEMKTLSAAEQEGHQVLQALGATSLEDLRNLPADAMYADRGVWSLIEDGAVLTDSIGKVFDNGAQPTIPLLCGFTRDEATPFPSAGLNSREKFIAHVRQHFGDSAARILDLYPHGNDTEAMAASYALRRDQTFAYQPWRFARLQQRLGVPVHLFEFEHAPPLPTTRFHELTPQGGFGAYHGAELWYVFNTLDAQPWAWTDADRALANAMSSYWVNFARTGDPNDASLPHWPRFATGHGDALLLGNKIRSGTPSNLAALQSLERHFTH